MGGGDKEQGLGGRCSDAGQLMQQVGRQDSLQLLQDVAQRQVQPAQHLQHNPYGDQLLLPSP